MESKQIKWLLLIVAIGIYFSMQNSVPVDSLKEAVSDVTGKPCAKAADCPCWGSIKVNGVNTSVMGIGKASCETCTAKLKDSNATFCQNIGVGTLACDTSYCFDIEPVADWAKDRPLQWAHENTALLLVMLVLFGIIIFGWPKA